MNTFSSHFAGLHARARRLSEISPKRNLLFDNELAGKIHSIPKVSGDRDALREASEQMESLFVQMVFKEMRSSIGKYRLVPTGLAGDIFEDMLYEKYSEMTAKNTKLGLAEMLYRQLSGERKKPDKSIDLSG